MSIQELLTRTTHNLSYEIFTIMTYAIHNDTYNPHPVAIWRVTSPVGGGGSPTCFCQITEPILDLKTAFDSSGQELSE